MRLSQGHEALVVCEGIETGLSPRQWASRVSGTEVWAGLSTSGIKGLVLPALEGRRLIVAADGDDRREDKPPKNWRRGRRGLGGWLSEQLPQTIKILMTF